MKTKENTQQHFDSTAKKKKILNQAKFLDLKSIVLEKFWEKKMIEHYCVYKIVTKKSDRLILESDKNMLNIQQQKLTNVEIAMTIRYLKYTV